MNFAIFAWSPLQLDREGTISVVFLCVALAGGAAFAVRWLLQGPVPREDEATRAAGGMFGSRSRAALAWFCRPLDRVLSAWNVSPNAVTVFSLVPAAAAAWFAAAGQFAAAGVLYLSAGACDFIDGRLARSGGRGTRGGALLDSVLDRYVECAFLIGIGWYYRHTWVAPVVSLLLCGSLLVPYIRARGEGLGLKLTTGFMQRPERVVLLGLAAVLTPLLDAGRTPTAAFPAGRILIVCITFLAVASHLTAVQRLWHAVRMLDRGPGKA